MLKDILTTCGGLSAMMSVIVFVCLGLFHDSIAHWIHARAEMIEAKAEKIEAEAKRIRNGLKEEKENA